MKSSGSEYQYGSKSAKRRVNARQDTKLGDSMRTALMAARAIAAAVMLVLSLFVRVELTEINDKNVELSRQAQSLHEENRRLRIEYEFSQDLDALEKDAKSRLGMQSELQRRTETIDTSPEDRAYIADNG